MKKITRISKNNVMIAVCICAISLTLPHCDPALAASQQSPSANSIAEQLNWMATNDPHNICHGYFVEPVLDAGGQPILPTSQSVTSINADSGSFSQKTQSVLTGNVVILQPGRRLMANSAILYPDSNGKFQSVQLTGDVRAYEPGQMFVADTAHYNLVNKTGTLSNVKYRTVLAPTNTLQNYATPISSSQDRVTGNVAWGQATQAVQTQPGHTVYSHVTYTTCSPDAAEWKLIASKMHLNKQTEMGNAENVRLDVEGVPIFYTPYMSFPLSNARKSGFLFPIYGQTSISGTQFGIPYYWNIAPNYDDTFTPTWYSKRGILFQNKFRFLTQSSNGQFLGSFIPNDAAFGNFKKTAPENYPGQFGLPALENASTNRYAMILRDSTQFDPKWSGLIDYSLVSDDYFLQDFGAVPEEIALNQLLQRGQIQYQNQNWVFTSLVQGYQTLHPVNIQGVPNVYSMLPQLSLNGGVPDIWKDLNFTWLSQGTYFAQTSTGPGSSPVEAGRFDVRPGLNYPITWIWGYLTPEVQMDSSYYALRNQPVTGGITSPANISRNLPMFDIHSGLYFDRNVSIHKQDYDQTLEPELFYLYVPYDNQNNIPIFDSGMIPFDYSQLFSTNRFSGYDRVGDANQVSYALTTRFIDDQTGEEKFRFSAGQIYYFQNRQVQLCNTPGCSDFLTGLGATPSNETVSPIASTMTYHFNPIWSFTSGYAWDPTVDRSITGSAYFTWSPGINEILNVGYTFLRNGNIINTVPLGSSQNNLNQISLSGSWPINDHWSTVAIFNYNISQERPQTYLGGLEYDTCCIRFRFVGGRVFSNVNQIGKYATQNAMYFQIQFKGLGNVGDNSISNILTRNIGGYVDPFETSSFGNFNI